MLDKVIFLMFFVKLNKKLLIIVVLVVSIGFGFFLVIVMEILNNGICFSEDVEKKLN